MCYSPTLDLKLRNKNPILNTTQQQPFDYTSPSVDDEYIIAFMFVSVNKKLSIGQLIFCFSPIQ